MATTPKYGRQFRPEMYFSRNDLNIAQSIYDGDTTLVYQIPDLEVNKINDKGICFLHYTIYVGNDRAMEILLKKGADPNIYCKIRPGNSDFNDDTTPLSNASGWHNLNAIKILMKYGANPNDNRATPALLNAVKRHDREMVDYLLDHGANIHIQHAVTKENALLQAANILDYNMVNHLLDRGANPMQRNVSGDCLAYTVQFEIRTQIERGRGTEKFKKDLYDLKKRLEGMGVVFPVEKIPPSDDDNSSEYKPASPPPPTPSPAPPVSQVQNPNKKRWTILFDDDDDNFVIG